MPQAGMGSGLCPSRSEGGALHLNGVKGWLCPVHRVKALEDGYTEVGGWYKE